MNKIERIIRQYIVNYDLTSDDMGLHPLLPLIVKELLDQNKIMFDKKSNSYIWIGVTKKQMEKFNKEFVT